MFGVSLGQNLNLITNGVKGSLPSPPYPFAAYSKGIQGSVVVLVHFDADGQADTCRVSQSSGSKILDETTTTFILKNWRSRPLAGTTQSAPIQYLIPDTFEKGNILNPPNFLLPGEEERHLTLRISFGMGGVTTSAAVIKSSGSEKLDEQTKEFVRTHWFTKGCKGQTIDVPFIFKPPLPPKPPPS